MREIKFKGKTKEGKWIYGDLFRGMDGDMYIHIVDDYGQNVEVLPNTIGQYTGLKDANRKEIYEGDIIVVKELHDNDEDCWNSYKQCPIPQVVTWYECGFDFGGCYRITAHPRHFAVIGNIHDNPELIEK